VLWLCIWATWWFLSSKAGASGANFNGAYVCGSKDTFSLGYLYSCVQVPLAAGSSGKCIVFLSSTPFSVLFINQFSVSSNAIATV